MDVEEKLEEIRHKYTVALREGDTDRADELYHEAESLKSDDEPESEPESEPEPVEDDGSDDVALEDFEAIKGIGDEIAEELYEDFGTLEAVRNASDEELTDISGIGSARADSIRDQLADE